MSCGVDCRRGSDPVLLWLWCRLAATAPIRPLAWEPPYAVVAAQEMAKRQKKKKKKKRKNKGITRLTTDTTPQQNKTSTPIEKCANSSVYIVISQIGRGQQATEKLIIITHYKRNSSPNYMEVITSHMSQWPWFGILQKNQSWRGFLKEVALLKCGSLCTVLQTLWNTGSR